MLTKEEKEAWACAQDWEIWLNIVGLTSTQSKDSGTRLLKMLGLEGSLPVPLGGGMDPDCCLCLWPKQQFSISIHFRLLGRRTRECFFWGFPCPPGWLQCWRWQSRETWSVVIGKNAPPDLNLSGVLLLDLCGCHRLTIGNVMFKHKGVHLSPWHLRPSCLMIDIVVM